MNDVFHCDDELLEVRSVNDAREEPAYHDLTTHQFIDHLYLIQISKILHYCNVNKCFNFYY